MSYDGLGGFGKDRGASEHRSEPYEKYGERGVERQQWDLLEPAIPKLGGGSTRPGRVLADASEQIN